MKQKFTVLLGIILIGLLIFWLWWSQAIKPPVPDDEASVLFSIESGENIRSIADKLQKQNLIRSPVAFFLLARFGSVADKIQAGEFRLSRSADMYKIADSLTHGTVDVQITIPEGYRNEEIALKLAQSLSIPENEFLKAAEEGFMFPDTYLIPKEASASQVSKIFLDNFNKKVTEKEISLIKQKNLTLDEVINIASIVEREAKLDEDRPLVASVILNRLNIGMKLDIDATIQYALGYIPAEKSWWKKEITLEDLEIDSPYNTYKNPGLPPTPIANPGLKAILAVLEAPKTDYLYYIADKTGKSHFAVSFEEHARNIAKYLNK